MGQCQRHWSHLSLPGKDDDDRWVEGISEVRTEVLRATWESEVVEVRIVVIGVRTRRALYTGWWYKSVTLPPRGHSFDLSIRSGLLGCLRFFQLSELSMLSKLGPRFHLVGITCLVNTLWLAGRLYFWMTSNGRRCLEVRITCHSSIPVQDLGPVPGFKIFL